MPEPSPFFGGCPNGGIYYPIHRTDKAGVVPRHADVDWRYYHVFACYCMLHPVPPLYPSPNPYSDLYRHCVRARPCLCPIHCLPTPGLRRVGSAILRAMGVGHSVFQRSLSGSTRTAHRACSRPILLARTQPGRWVVPVGKNGGSSYYFIINWGRGRRNAHQ